jgi:hypothetical protein
MLFVLRRLEFHRELTEQDHFVHPERLLTLHQIAVADLNIAGTIF